MSATVGSPAISSGAPDGPLDVLEQPVLPRLDQRDRDPLAPRATGPTDPVDVAVRRGRYVVVDDVADVPDVETSGRDIGGHQDVEGAVPEARHDPVALLLGQAAVERRRVPAATAERLGQVVDLATSPGEHEGRGPILEVQDPPQRGELVGAPDHVRDLADPRLLSRDRPLPLQVKARGVAEVRLREPCDRPGDGCREQGCLAGLGQRRQDAVEVVRETHVQHLVRLVEHHDLDVVEAQRPAVEVVDDAARRGHDDVHAASQAVELRRDRLAAVYGHDADSQLAPVPVHGLGNLHGELAGRSEHQRCRPAAAPVLRGATSTCDTPGIPVGVQACGQALQDG